MDRTRPVVAELIGTFCLVFFGVGSAVFGIDALGPVGVALAFGLVLLALAYAIGPISGCHVNPAVTLGALIARRVDGTTATWYVAAQVVGGLAAAGVLKLMVGPFGDVVDQTGALGTNSYGTHVSAAGAFVAELLLTALLVLVVLLVTEKSATPGFGGLAIGVSLVVIHLVGIPLTGTSVNPARSIGPALLAGSHATGQLWLFILAPLVGAVAGVLLWHVVRPVESAVDGHVKPAAATSTT